MIDESLRYERANRLDVIIKSLNLNGKSFANTIGVTQGTISNLLNAKRNITVDFIEKIALRHPTVNLSWLLFGEGDAFLKADQRVERATASNELYLDDAELAIIASNIVTIRRRWKRDQEEFGQLIGATRNQVSNWERRRTKPDYNMLSQLESLTGIDQKKIRTHELTRSEIPELPRPDAVPLPPIPVSLDDVYRLQQEILERIANIEAILRSIKEQGQMT